MGQQGEILHLGHHDTGHIETHKFVVDTVHIQWVMLGWLAGYLP